MAATSFSSHLLLFLCLLLSINGRKIAPAIVRFYDSGSCPYAQRAWIALEESGTKYSTVTVDLQHKSQEFLDIYARANPLPGARAKVPVLHVGENGDDDEAVLCESSVVAEYIAEVYSDSNLSPSSALDRATMRLFTELCSSKFSFFPLLLAQESAEFESEFETFKEGLVNVNSFLARKSLPGGPFLFGEQFSLAECISAPFLIRCCAILPSMENSVDPLKLCDELGLIRLKQWIEAVIARPSVVATCLSKEEMIKSFRAKMKDFAAMKKK